MWVWLTDESADSKELDRDGAMFFSITGVVKAIIIIVFTAAIAWFMGYINEKNANGSIVPSWIIHAIANIFSATCAAFSVF